jgi:hypothetical protein
LRPQRFLDEGGDQFPVVAQQLLKLRLFAQCLHGGTEQFGHCLLAGSEQERGGPDDLQKFGNRSIRVCGGGHGAEDVVAWGAAAIGDVTGELVVKVLQGVTANRGTVQRAHRVTT